MKIPFVILKELMLLIAAMVIAFATFSLFRHACGDPNGGACPIVGEMGFPVRVPSGYTPGVVEPSIDNQLNSLFFAFIINSGFYFLVLNLGAVLYKKLISAKEK